MNTDLIIAVSVVGVFLIVFGTTMYVLYRRMIKNKKSYSRNKVINGDVFLDDVCGKYLTLSNLHIPE